MIITSILDLDLYKLTVGEVIFTYFRSVKGKYRLTVRNGEKIDYWKYVPLFALEPELRGLKDLSLTKEEAEKLRKMDLFDEDYIQFLMNKPMNNVHLSFAYQDGTFNTPVPEVNGDWCRAMLYEIFCLSIGNELFARRYALINDISMDAVVQTASVRLDKKIQEYTSYNARTGRKLNITEFGTRRRLSKAWQEEVVCRLWKAGLITGTSNVYLGLKYDIPVRGTFGHEFTMGMQGITRIQDSQKDAFKLWLSHWEGKLKIALDDTLGTSKFLRDFTKELAQEYDGLRHDSGPWKEWTHERLRMYDGFGIDPETKTLFYSDGLNPYTVMQIDTEFAKDAKLAFGIGTDFTNDSFLPVPQVVMKIVSCNGQPVAKLSNNPAKACCDSPEYLAYIRTVAEKL